MRLPQNKQDRMKLWALLAVLAVGAVYGLWAGLCAPLRARADDTRAQSRALETKIRNAEVRIQRARRIRTDLEERAATLLALSEDHLLHPQLGNYVLRAREPLTAYAREAGLRGVRIEDMGLIETPRGPAAASPLVSAYALRVFAETDYASFTAWVAALEEANPLIGISHFMVTAQPDQPARHLVRFEVQWPIWADPADRVRVREKIQQLLDEVGS